MAEEVVNAAAGNEAPQDVQNTEGAQPAAAPAAEGVSAGTPAEGTENSLLTEGLGGGEGGKSEGEEGAAEKTAAKEEPSAPEVPERYELTMPEGWTLDEEGLAELTPIMRELKASNEQVQAVADLYIRRMSAARERQIAAELKYGSEDFYNYLDDSSLGNYPPFVKVMVKIAKELEDDKFIPGGGAFSDDPASAAAKMIFDKSLKD